jgi:flagellar motor switch protein FliN
MWRVMNNSFLSQEEINSLLSGEESGPIAEVLSEKEKDMIREIGKVSMESAAKTLAMITNQEVKIDTPVVTTTTFGSFRDDMEAPYMASEVKYVSGIEGRNLLINKIRDAQVIANLMMGGDGRVEDGDLTELEESAVSEAMNQMIGSAATSMAGILSREVNISPPISTTWKDNAKIQLDDINEEETLIKVSYNMKIGSFIDSELIQLLTIKTGRKIAEIMTTKEKKAAAPVAQAQPQMKTETQRAPMESYQQQPVEVQQASFQPLKESGSKPMPKNIDLILDVPLEISVVLGRTRKCIKDILNLGTGSLIELDKLAEEPVEVLVNGKQVAFGEVVVVGENFGVRITSIVNSTDRLKSFGR